MSRKVYAILALFLSFYIVLTLLHPGGLMAYVLPSVCWATLALVTLYAMGGLGKLSSWTNKRIALMALLVAAFQIFIFIDAGLINKFGESPLAFTTTGIALNAALVSSGLLGMELSRGYLAKNLSRKKPTITLIAITLLYTFANVSILALITFTDPLNYTKFMGGTFLPILAENLLATYLALMSGPSASLAYRAPLQAFQWFSPILPDLPWGYKALIGVMTPTIGFIAINMATTQKDLRKAGILTRRKPILKRKDEKSMKGWLAISVFLVLTVWTTTGLFGFYPTIIASGSMTPTMEVGDIAIVVSTDPAKIQVGDVIQFWNGEEMMLHRVNDIKRQGSTRYFETKGDDNTIPDPDFILPTQIKGKLLFTIPKLGWVSIALKEFFTNAYTFLTALPQTLTTASNWIITNGVYLTTALALTASSYLLVSFRGKKKEEKN